jgi:hypothetical protein
MKKHFLFATAIIIISACSNTGTKTNTQQDQIVITNDLENAKGVIPSWVGEDRVIQMSKPPAHSGIYAGIVKDTSEYSYYYEEILKNINSKLPTRVIFSGWIYTSVSNPLVSVVCNLNENKERYNWKVFPLDKELTEVGKWVPFSTDFYFGDKPLKPDLQIGIFVWYKGKTPVYIDDLKVTFLY